MSKILLIGGGGHCKSVLNTIISSNSQYDTISIIDRPERCGEKICGIEIIGTDNDIESLFQKGYKEAFVTLGSIGNPTRRIELYKKIKRIGFSVPVIRDISASVSNYAKVDEGVFIGKNVVINADAEIQIGSIINTSATIEHDCKIGKFVHIASGSIICGNCIIGDNVHIGANSTIIQGTDIGINALVGAGAVVIKNIESRAVVVGNPGRRIR